MLVILNPSDCLCHNLLLHYDAVKCLQYFEGVRTNCFTVHHEVCCQRLHSGLFCVREHIFAWVLHELLNFLPIERFVTHKTSLGPTAQVDRHRTGV